MKKIVTVSAISLLVVTSPSLVLARGGQQSQAGQQSQGSQQRIQDPEIHDEVVVSPGSNQVKNQIETQNKGEESQLKVNTQESLEAGEEEGLQSQGEVVRQNMGMVAEKVKEFLGDREEREGIGQQVRDIVSQQEQAQEEVVKQLDKLESRSGLMKKLFGADLKAIKSLKQQIEQNQLRIQELQELQAQVTNQADEAQIEELIQVLVEQNTALEDQVQAEEQVGGLFGWLVRLFVN